MSESLQIAEHAPETPKDSSQKLKAVVVTGLMTALTAFGVSFIGIVPNLRRGDRQDIYALTQKLNDIESRVHEQVNNSNAPEKKLTIKGIVKSKDGKQRLKGFDVYFLPEGNNLLTAKTDDAGTFYKEMPPGAYSIIVREPIKGLSGKGMLFDNEGELPLEKLQGAVVNYSINRW